MIDGVVLFTADSRFTQQELPACKPILTPGWVSFSSYYSCLSLPSFVFESLSNLSFFLISFSAGDFNVFDH